MTSELEKTLESEFKDIPAASIQDEIARELDGVLNSDSDESDDADTIVETLSSDISGVEESEDLDVIAQEAPNESENMNNIMDEVEKSLSESEEEEIIAEEDLEDLAELEGLDDSDIMANDSGVEEDAFNETELAEIMNEIEDVEAEFENANPEISEEDENIYAYIPDFPVNIIALEKCTDTLDAYMMYDDVSDKEWSSILMQVIFTLLIYQKTFSFTHNDLHTNNIMYISTNKKFIYYT